MTAAVPPLGEAMGARQELTVVLPVRLLRVPDWPEGPFPFELGSRRTDTLTRSTYFAPASARVLYGAPGRPCRWHLPVDVKHDGLLLLGMELLRAATARKPEHALAVLHFSVDRPLLPVLRALAGRRPSSVDEPLTGPFDPAELLTGVADVRAPGAPFAIARPYTIAFMAPTAQHSPVLRPGLEAVLPTTADRWLWQLASRSTPQDFPLAPETAHEQLKDIVRISADWSALVLRQGTAFLGHRPDTGAGDFFEFGALHSRTVYLDALLLGSLQRDHIDELTDELSAVFDSPRLTRRVSALEKNIAVFRSTYWRQHLTAHGPANELLLAFQNQHRLPARFNEILAEAADYSRLVQTQESQQISGTLGVLTVLGLPLGTALGILLRRVKVGRGRRFSAVDGQVSPDRLAGLPRAHTPVVRQGVDDDQSAPADVLGVSLALLGHLPLVRVGDFEDQHAVSAPQPDLEELTDAPRVLDGVGSQFADDQLGIVSDCGELPLSQGRLDVTSSLGY